jgi:hypothetical protein
MSGSEDDENSAVLWSMVSTALPPSACQSMADPLQRISFPWLSLPVRTLQHEPPDVNILATLPFRDKRTALKFDIPKPFPPGSGPWSRKASAPRWGGHAVAVPVPTFTIL